MRSSFFEFGVATSGLFTARAGLDVTSHNISNAATKGYSRQYIEQRASMPLSFHDGRGMVGTGSDVYGVGQHRSFYLDKKYWSESSVLGEYSIKSSYLEVVEGLLNEFNDNGIKSGLDNFFKTLQDLKTSAGDDTCRTNVLEVSKTLAKLVNNTAESLKKQQNDINTEIGTIVKIINSSAQQIKSLNKEITNYELDGTRANDLRDERARLVDELSKYVNVTVIEKEYNKDYEKGLYPDPEDRGKSEKRFAVYINGYELVNHFDAQSLMTVERDTKNNPTDVPGLVDLEFSGSGLKFDLHHHNLKGELKGLIDMRDGNNGNLLGGQATQSLNYKGIPHYMNKLNDLVRTFAKAINEGLDSKGNAIPGVTGHKSGYDAYGNLGKAFFTQNGESTVDYDLLTCENFSVNQELINDPKKIATAINSLSDESDNNVILGFLNITSYNSLFNEGKLEDFVIGLSTELGIDKKQADNFATNYTDVLNSIDNQRIAVSGVDVNEEMINLVKYNQLYQASAKLVNIIDGIYDTCINRMGV